MVFHGPFIACVPAPGSGVAKKASDKGEHTLTGQVPGLQITIVSLSGRFLKTKYCQNHEQDAWPEEFGERKDLE